MQTNNRLIRYITATAAILAFIVVVLGAYTRLTHAGLSCPDWPGCYGRIVLPQQGQALTNAQAKYPAAPLELKKAWTEMAHRYVAFLLALLILYIGIYYIYQCIKSTIHAPVKSTILQNRNELRSKIAWKLPMLLMFLVVFQAALGMWTVTWQLLPLVVMGHLITGMTIFACLCLLAVHANNLPSNTQANNELNAWRIGIGLAVIIVFVQIALGGWVSANYAGMACIGFPRCNGQWLPPLDLIKGFNLFSPLGQNYLGGLLTNTARVAIQEVHRLGALITLLYVCGLGLLLWKKALSKKIKNWIGVIIFLVFLQVLLGILNVVYWLPLAIATLHNGVAALLLASLIILFSFSQRKTCH